MARGHADYGTDKTAGVKRTITDLAELAVRLGSIVNVYQSGNVLFAIDFDSTISPVKASSVGAGSNVALDTTRSVQGAGSVLLYVANVSPGNVTIQQLYGATFSGKIAIGFWFQVRANLDKFSITLGYEGASARYHGSVVYSETNTKWQYEDSGGTFQDIVSLPSAYDYQNEVWHFVKLIIDTDVDEYVSLQIDNDTYDISGNALYSLSLADEQTLFWEIKLFELAGKTPTLNIDNLTTTINEV